MADITSADLARLLGGKVEQASPDLLRAMVKTFADALMGAEADAICGAPYGQVSEERVNYRNGYRDRRWDTRAGTIELAIPRLRQGSYFPEWLLERRRRSEQALITVVATSYLLGVSTRRVEKLAETLGIKSLSKSQVSELAKSLDGAAGRDSNGLCVLSLLTENLMNLTIRLAVAAAGVLAAGCGAAAGPPSASHPATPHTSAPASAPATTAPAVTAPATVASGGVALQQDYVSTIRRVLPSVVEIRTASGLGSGVVYDAAGHIVTNAHVVGSATSFQVFLAGSAKPLPARLTGSYPPDDLAVIQVTGAAHLVPAHFADSSRLQVGDIVLAMGNPLGLASSVTDGIISATGRTVSESAEGGSPGATLPDVIQTSAAINPGNSGGALADLADQVVGIPTLAATDQQLGGAAPGIGFAIPSNIVTNIAGQIIKTGHVTNSHRAALGAEVQTVTGPNGQPAGVSIAAVTPGGPAAKAGLQPGDVITAVNGTATPDTVTLAAVLAGLRPGQQVPVTVTKTDGSTATIHLILRQLPGT